MGALAASVALAGQPVSAAEPALANRTPGTAGRRIPGAVPAPTFPEFQAPQLFQPRQFHLPKTRLRWLESAGIGPAPAGSRVDDLPQAAAKDAPVRFDIPAGPLDGALKAFEKLTGLTVQVSEESIRTIPSPGVSGSFTPEQALQQLLTGTGVSYRFPTATSVRLDVGGLSESVEVSGARQRVSSAKYTGPLRDTPQTVTVINREIMEQQGAMTLSDALRNVPGITMQAGEGGGSSSTAGDMFNMRGFNASNSLFVDGVRDDGLVARDVFNLEQVEVYSGPTGSDVGRGTASGYVNMATKTPKALATYGGSFAFGSSDQRRLAVDINQPLAPKAKNTWLGGSAFRLNALVQDSGVPGRDYVSRESKGLAPSLALGLNSHVRVSAGGQFVRQDNLPDYGIPTAAWSENQLAPTGTIAPGEVRQANYYGSPDYDYDDVSQDSYTGRVELDIKPSLTLRNQTRYNKTHRSAVITAVTSPNSYAPATGLVTVARQGNERDNQITSNQTNLSAAVRTGTVTHALRGGLEITSEKQFAPTLTGLGTRAPVDIYHPDVFSPVTGMAVGRTAAFTDGDTTTAALYAFDTVDLGSRLQATGGIRWERYDTNYLAVDATGATTTDLDTSKSLVSGKAGLVFKITGTGNAYVSYANSKTPPGSANFSLSTQDNNANNPNVKPQISTNIEVGTKWDVLQSRLSLTAAAFRTKNENVIYTVDSTAVPPIFNYDDAQQVNGAVFGASGRIVPGWDVTANFALLDSENKSQNATNAGKQLTLTPKFSGSLWTSYRFPIGVMLGGGVRHTDQVFVNAANTIRVPGYSLVDMVAQYEITRQLSLRLNINNLTNETYIRNINNNAGRYNPGNPRAGLLTIVANF
jgi:catecholate siderophore receptor